MARLKELFKKNTFTSLSREEKREEGPSVPDGMFVKCPKCGEMVYKEDVRENFYCCPKCDGNFRINWKSLINLNF